MTSTSYDPAAPESDLRRRGIRLGDVLFQGIAVAASLAAPRLLVWIAYKVIDLAWPAIQEFGLSVHLDRGLEPRHQDVYGALAFIYGTLVTSAIALLLATPISIAIALFLTEIAPRRIAAPIATMVELLAAIPSVVLGPVGHPRLRPVGGRAPRALARERGSAGSPCSPASRRRRASCPPRSC